MTAQMPKNFQQAYQLNRGISRALIKHRTNDSQFFDKKTDSVQDKGIWHCLSKQ